MDHPGITRQMHVVERLTTIQAVIDHYLMCGRAAEHLGMSVRQIERLVLRYRPPARSGSSPATATATGAVTARASRPSPSWSCASSTWTRVRHSAAKSCVAATSTNAQGSTKAGKVQVLYLTARFVTSRPRPRSFEGRP
jgi:hypothetical protein